jgi:hypothetical protein
MTRPPFIERHALWTDDQRRQAEALRERVRTEALRLVRLAWTDAHGYVRAKAVTPPAFLESLAAGYNINVATTTLDSANARTFASFTRGGGMGIDAMTGSPNARSSTWRTGSRLRRSLGSRANPALDLAASEPVNRRRSRTSARSTCASPSRNGSA